VGFGVGRTRRSHCGSRPGVWGRREVRIDAMVYGLVFVLVFGRIGRVGGSWGVFQFLGMRWGVRLN
jgi:hypothetical protein